jgi:hypothetical protein
MKIGVPLWKVPLLFLVHVILPFLASPFGIAAVVKFLLWPGK